MVYWRAVPESCVDMTMARAVGVDVGRIAEMSSGGSFE